MSEKQASVVTRIAELACLPMFELWAVWDRYFPRRPDYPNRTHVESRLAYKLQEEAFGGLAPATRQRLEAIGAKNLFKIFLPICLCSLHESEIPKRHQPRAI